MWRVWNILKRKNRYLAQIFLIKTPVVIMTKLMGCRFFLPHNIDRIGHLVVEIEVCLKEAVNDNSHKPLFFFMRTNIAANAYLLKLWKKRVRIIPVNLWYEALLKDCIARQKYPYIEFVYTQRPRKQRAFHSYRGKPLLCIPEEDAEKGLRELETLGVPRTAWFVCFHMRDRTYLPHLAYHSYRDVVIPAYYEAMRLVVRRGGYVVRLGNPESEPLPKEQGIIDYAHSNLRSDFLDVFISTRCRFYVGTNSGPKNLPRHFNVPVCMTNHIPMADIVVNPGSLLISKRLYSEEKKRVLSFRDMLAQPVADYHRREQYDTAGLQLIDNTAEEIRDVVEEMLDAMEGGVEYTDEDERMQKNFRALCHEAELPFPEPSRIGRNYLRSHAELLNGS